MTPELDPTVGESDALAEITPAAREESLVLLKPDAVAQELTILLLDKLHSLGSDVQIDQMEGFDQVPAEMWKQHYRDLVDKPFYPTLEAFMMSGPVVAMIVSGQQGIIGRIRTLLGPTDSSKAPPETIRGQFGSKTEVMKNVMHASDSPESAQREINIFFPNREAEQAGEVVSPTDGQETIAA